MDGCTLTARRSNALWEYFDSAEGSHYPQASVVVVLADVLARVLYDVRIGPFGVDERAALLDLSAKLDSGDIILLDRGFPSHQVIDALARQGIDFVMRVSTSEGFRKVEDFVASDEPGERELVVNAHGFEKCTTPVTIEAGWTKEVQVVLTAKRD